MTLKFGNHTIDISNLEWYRIFDKLRGEVRTTHYRVDVVKGNEAVCEAGFPWSEDLLLSAVLNVGGRPGVIACELGGQACPGATAAERETYLFDLEAGKWDPFERIGIELYYWVAEEYRLYSVRTLVTKEEFNIIKQNIVSEFERNYTGPEDRRVSDRLWYFDFIDFIQPRNYVYEGHEHCAYDNYAWDFLPQDLGKW